MLEEAGALHPGARVLEIGPGAGQATRELLNRGAEVIAVEMGANFAARLRAELAGHRLTVVEGDFDSLTGMREDFRLAVCAASLHWLDSATAIPRIAALLRPGGWFAAWWTIYGDPTRPSVFRESLDGVLRRHRPAGGLKGAREPLDHDAWIEELSTAGVFDDIRAEIIRWAAVMSAEQTARLYGTFAVVRELPESRREALLRDIAQVVDDLGGHVVEHFLTPVYLARKAP
ncbi:class I SAM-dependent methyltransferase [Microbispora sp. ZYX-F-249]|uniref:Class I SAM-dependent methyltransferase n=1 Tax=Microbispora maris TaxID=3144104 RepID=A0ABV0AMU6_9ACTN